MPVNKSTFKLFMHCQQGSADGELRRWRDTLGIIPDKIQVFRWNHCREVKEVDARIETILRDPELSMEGYYYGEGADPPLTAEQLKARGREFVRAVKSRAGGNAPDGGDWRYVDTLLFMSEKSTFDNPEVMRRLDLAGQGFVEECARERKKPGVHSFAFANPRPDLVYWFGASIRAAIQVSGYMVVNQYGPFNLFESAPAYVLSVDGLVAELARPHAPQYAGDIAWPGFVVPPEQVLVGEFGHDVVSDPNFHGVSGAWMDADVPPQQIKAEFDRYHNELAQRRYAGACMYNCYGYENDRYELKRVLIESGWYGQKLVEHQGPPVPPVPTPTPPPTSGGTYQVIAPDGLRVREAPNTGARVLGVLPFGARVLALSVAGGWARLGLSAGGSILVAGASDPDPCAYADAGWLRRV